MSRVALSALGQRRGARLPEGELVIAAGERAGDRCPVVGRSRGGVVDAGDRAVDEVERDRSRRTVEQLEIAHLEARPVRRGVAARVDVLVAKQPQHLLGLGAVLEAALRGWPGGACLCPDVGLGAVRRRCPDAPHRSGRRIPHA